MQPQTFIFAGPSGSGKGTQVEALKAKLTDASSNPLRHFYTGEHFRAYMKNQANTRAGEISQKINERGGLQPSFLAIWLWADYFVQNLTGGEDLVIDGSPRTMPEAHALDSAIRFYDRAAPHVIVINVGQEEAKRRLMERGRADDTEESIGRRLDWYKSEVEPAIDMYRDMPEYHFHDIDGEQSVERVTHAILEALALNNDTNA